jgi:hypothetical protein
MRCIHQFAGSLGLKTRQGHAQFDVQRKAAVVVRADADICRDGGVSGQCLLALTGDELHRAQKARRVSGCEELLGVRADRAVAAQFTRRGQLDIQHLIRRYRAAIASTRAGCRCFVKYAHLTAPWLGSEDCRASRSSSSSRYGLKIAH